MLPSKYTHAQIPCIIHAIPEVPTQGNYMYMYMYVCGGLHKLSSPAVWWAVQRFSGWLTVSLICTHVNIFFSEQTSRNVKTWLVTLQVIVCMCGLDSEFIGERRKGLNRVRLNWFKPLIAHHTVGLTSVIITMYYVNHSMHKSEMRLNNIHVRHMHYTKWSYVLTSVLVWWLPVTAV